VVGIKIMVVVEGNVDISYAKIHVEVMEVVLSLWLNYIYSV
jgi:hypothetical protein